MTTRGKPRRDQVEERLARLHAQVRQNTTAMRRIAVLMEESRDDIQANIGEQWYLLGAIDGVRG